jgi:hypothetical protein
MCSRAKLSRIGVASAVFFAVVAATREAPAGASARLVYSRGPGAESCPGDQAIRAAVRARLGYDPFFPWARDTLVVEIAGDKATLHVRVTLVDEKNEQRGARDLAVHGQDCTSLVDAMGLTISLVIDPSAIVGTPSPAPAADPATTDATAATPEPAAPPPSVLAPAPPPGDAPAITAPAAPRVSLHVGIGGAGSIGASTAPSVGGAVFVGVQWRALAVDLEGRADAPSSGDTNGVHVQTHLDAVSIVPCLRGGPVFGCALFGVGSLSASATGSAVAQTLNQSEAWVGAGARAGVVVPLGSALSVRIYGDLLVSPVTPFRLERTNVDAGKVGPLAGSLGVAIAWRIF